MRIFSRILWQLVDFSLLSASFSIESAAHEHIQQPIFSHDGDTGKDVVRGSRWNFNFTSSAPHYFASVYGLLQQWPQTFFPNGHSIVPCELPPLTKLYHGRRDGDVPPSPEWVAFDIGMAYGIMGSSRNSHMLTYQTTRPVKCIYFDGESATLFGTGQLDTQMLHIWGNVSGPSRPSDGFRGLWDEYARAIGLCDWLSDKRLGGLGWGYEGIVRMNAGFEMIWCNFSSPSIRLLSHLNVTAPLLPAPEEEEVRWEGKGKEYETTSYFPLPPTPTRSDKATDPSNPPQPPVGGRDWMAREPFYASQAWNWFTSAADHYGSSGSGPGIGEMRVKLSSCGFLSYYSPVFEIQASARAQEERKALNLTKDGLWEGPGENGTRKIALAALTRRRRQHTLEDVTTSEAAIMRTDSELVLHDLLGKSTNCSGVDWYIMSNDIVQNYASSLSLFNNYLKTFSSVPAKNHTSLTRWMITIRDQTHTLLLPFLEYPSSNETEDIWIRDSPLFQKTYSRCRFQYTRLLDPDEGIFLGLEESRLKWAAEETLGGICSVIVDVGLSVEGIWQKKFNVPPSNSTASLNGDWEKVQEEVLRWTQGVEELMAWLGWAGEWVNCEEKCAWDERCFIPMWPMIPFRRPGGGGGRGRGPGRGPPGYGYERPGYGGPPRYGGPPGSGPPGSPPGNGTGRRPGRGFNPWVPDESALWEPTCVKSDYILNG